MLNLSLRAALLSLCILGLFACDTETQTQNDTGASNDTTTEGDTNTGGNDTSTINDTNTSGNDTTTTGDTGGGQDMTIIPPAGPCTPYPAPTGNTITVTPSEADQLPQIVRDAATGTTILLEDGTYTMTGSGEGSRRLNFRTPGVTMRSASGNAEAVVLDAEYITTEPIAILANDVTIAEFTVTHAVDHLVHATPGSGTSDVTGTMIYGMRFLDGGEQFIKINSNGDRSAWVDNGTVACSYFELTDAGRPNIERNPGGCYTGGIDAHGARGWHIHHNQFIGIYCAGEGLAEHAVHFWTGSRDTVVENNIIINCARGVGFGLRETGNGGERVYSDDPGVGYIGHMDGMIRNNVIFANINYYDTGIELQQARGARVLHNTVVSDPNATNGFYSSIDYRWGNTDVVIRNNIARRISSRNGANGTVDTNLENPPLSIFEDPLNGNFHLTSSASEAIDQGQPESDAGLDIDGETHDKGTAPDLGADER